MTTDRIPLTDFADFPTARLEGFTSGIRWQAAMEAFEQQRQREKAERIAMNEAAGYGRVERI